MAAAERGREARQRLLQVAAELIAERGWTAVTTRNLAQRAGIAPSLVHYLHYHFALAQAHRGVPGCRPGHHPRQALGEVIAQLRGQLVGCLTAHTVPDPHATAAVLHFSRSR